MATHSGSYSDREKDARKQVERGKQFIKEATAVKRSGVVNLANWLSKTERVLEDLEARSSKAEQRGNLLVQAGDEIDDTLHQLARDSTGLSAAGRVAVDQICEAFRKLPGVLQAVQVQIPELSMPSWLKNLHTTLESLTHDLLKLDGQASSLSYTLQDFREWKPRIEAELKNFRSDLTALERQGGEASSRLAEEKADLIREHAERLRTLEEEAKPNASALNEIQQNNQKLSEQARRIAALEEEAKTSAYFLKVKEVEAQSRDEELSKHVEELESVRAQAKATEAAQEKMRSDELSRHAEDLESVRAQAKVAEAARDDKTSRHVEALKSENSELGRRMRNLVRESQTAADALEQKKTEAAQLRDHITSLMKALEQTTQAASMNHRDLLSAAANHEAEKEVLSRRIDEAVQRREQAARKSNQLRLIKIPAEKKKILTLRKKARKVHERGAERLREIEQREQLKLRKLWTALEPEYESLPPSEESRICDTDLDLFVACSNWLDGVALRCEANCWLQNLQGLAVASATSYTSHQHALRLFREGTKDFSKVTLDDIVEMVQGLAEAPSLVKVLCPIWAYIQCQARRVKQTPICAARALILLRCIELVYLHVQHSHRLQPLRDEFWGMRSCFEKPAGDSVIVALLLEGLTQAVESGGKGSLSSHIVAGAQASLSINLQGIKIFSLGPCIMVEWEDKVYFCWPEHFRLVVKEGLQLMVDDLPEPGRQWKAPWECTKEGVEQLEQVLGDAHQRLLNTLPAAPREVFRQRE